MLKGFDLLLYSDSTRAGHMRRLQRYHFQIREHSSSFFDDMQRAATGDVPIVLVQKCGSAVKGLFKMLGNFGLILQYLTCFSQILRLSFPNGWKFHHLSGDGDLNLNTSLDVDDDLLDDLSGGVEVDQALVDSIVEISSAKVPIFSLSNEAKTRSSSMKSPGNDSSRTTQLAPCFFPSSSITHLIS